jgi:hypothetical protein
MLAAGPGAPDAIADDDDDAMGDDATGDDEAGAAGVVLDEEEPHAAAPRARVAAMPGTASRRRFFTVFSLTVVLFGAGLDASWQVVLGCLQGLR